MSLIVTIEAGAGFKATARQGPHEHEATASSPILAAKLAAAGITGREAHEAQVERKAPNTYAVTFKPLSR